MNENIILVNPPHNLKRRGIQQPIGIASIAAELEKHGYEGKVNLIDGCYLSKKYGYKSSIGRIGKEIEEKKPFVVGCSLHEGTAEETSAVCAYGLINGSHVILGGHLATARHEIYADDLNNLRNMCKSSSSTAIVRGEGEKTARELIDALHEGRSLEGIKGVTFYDGKKTVVNPNRELVDLNELEPPAYHLLQPLREYNDIVTIEESRGCAFKCSFCSITNTYQSYRLKSPERIKVEVERAKKLGAKEIDLLGELSLIDRERALKIADIMEEFGYEWTTDAHPSLIIKQKDILPTLRKKGLIEIETGIESANQNSLDAFNKGTTPKMNEEAIRILKKCSITPNMDFIVFQPYMKMNDLYKNIMFIIRNGTYFANHSTYPTNLMHSWSPGFGTPLYDKALSDGVMIIKNNKIRVKYKKKKVGKTLRNYRYFLDRYEKDYLSRHDRITKMCDEEHNNQEHYSDKRFNAVVKIPQVALSVSFMCADDKIPAKTHIDSLVKRSFDIIDNENFDDIFKSWRETYAEMEAEVKMKNNSKKSVSSG